MNFMTFARRHLSRGIIILVTAATSSLAQASVNWPLPAVEPQDDGWSCGVNSATRMLKAYGHEVDYQRLKERIGPYDYTFEMTVSLGPLGRLTRLSENLGSMGIGKPTPELTRALQGIDGSATYKTKSDIATIRSLLDRGRPVMALTLVGQTGFRVRERGITFLSAHYPNLHWYVIHGYDVDGFEVTDTDGNTGTVSYDDFQRAWDWSGWPRTGPVHEYLIAKGLDVRTIIYFDKPLPASLPATGPGSLAIHNANCTLDAPKSNACASAIHRYATAQGFGAAGVVQEVGDGLFGIAFVPRAEMFNMEIAELQTTHPGCSHPGAYTNACVAAIQRACERREYSAGFSQEVGPSSFGVACFHADQYRHVSMQDLHATGMACSHPDAQSAGCSAAIHRVCAAEGFAGGIAQQIGSDGFGVACFKGEYRNIRVQ